jgi:hypothetical protein
MGVSAMDGSCEDLAAALRTGAADAVARLRAAVMARRGEHGDHACWRRLCEQTGEAGLALTEYQLALRDDPEDDPEVERLGPSLRLRRPCGDGFLRPVRPVAVPVHVAFHRGEKRDH